MPQPFRPSCPPPADEIARLEKELAEANSKIWHAVQQHTEEACDLQLEIMKLRAALWYALHNDTRGNEDWRKAACEALKVTP